MKKYVVFSIFLGLVFMPYSAFAHVSGLCANCHTMHASQTPWPDGSEPGEPAWGDPSKLPKKRLLAKAGSSACVGCHSSATSSTWYDLDGCKVPVVLYTGGEPSSYLADGNFWWVSPDGDADDTKGHNVFLHEGDQYFGPDGTNNAPGNTILSCGGVENSCHQNLSEPFTGPDMGYNLPGKYGCEGCHLNVRHHANDHPNGQGGLVTTIDQGWYRFLSGHWEYGVKGYEHGLWEAGQPSLAQGQANNHNEYLGSASGGLLNATPTTTAFYGGCHLKFHTQKSGVSWIRHPSDAVIPDTAGSEYADTGGSSHLYDPLSPVASPTVDGTPDGTVTPGTDFVMCLSCHRPHGSPYPDLLR